MKPTELVVQILKKKQESIQQLKDSQTFESLARKANKLDPPRGFIEALRGATPLAIIAELKRASPSKGMLKPEFRPIEIAEQYQSAGANAISVLTEEHFFLGKPDYLSQVRQHVDIPLLRKDFLLDPIQIPESRVMGADAVLLIVSFLPPKTLRIMYQAALDFGLHALVEVHDESELEIALSIDADLIGINNRNLKTFEVDIATTFRLLPMIGDEKTIVSESGISEQTQIMALASAGAHAVLVGESLMRSDDVAQKLRSLRE